MKIQNHPQYLLNKDWIKTIRSYALEAEQQGQLHFEQLQLIYQQQWFKALVAQKYGGLEWALPQLVSFEEAIGWVDGSVGWVFTLCSGAGWFSGFLDEAFAKSIFNNHKACLAGSGAPSGRAVLQNDGNYFVSGEWSYASGAPDATVFTANCFVADTNQIKAFCFLRDEVEVLSTWQAIGLNASATHSFSVKELTLPKERCFEIEASKSTTDSPLYQYPFLQLAECTIAANLSGITLHFLEECEVYFKQKKHKDTVLWEEVKIQGIFDKAKGQWLDARNHLLETVADSWQILITQNNIPKAILTAVSQAAQQLAIGCRNAINMLYPYTGLTGANKHSPINKLWCDFHTASQHAIFMDLQ